MSENLFLYSVVVVVVVVVVFDRSISYRVKSSMYTSSMPQVYRGMTGEGGG